MQIISFFVMVRSHLNQFWMHYHNSITNPLHSRTRKTSKNNKQECIPVGCVPTAHRLYLPGLGGGGVGVGDKIIDSKKNFIKGNSGKKILKKNLN